MRWVAACPAPAEGALPRGNGLLPTARPPPPAAGGVTAFGGGQWAAGRGRWAGRQRGRARQNPTFTTAADSSNYKAGGVARGRGDDPRNTLRGLGAMRLQMYLNITNVNCHLLTAFTLVTRAAVLPLPARW